MDHLRRLPQNRLVGSFVALVTSRIVTWLGPAIALHAHLQTLLLLLLLEARTGSIYAVGIKRPIDAVLVPLGLQPLVLTQLQIPLL